MNLAESLLRGLADHGAGQLFGIPGDFALPLFDEIERTAILPLHTLSHEPGVGFAADAAARMTGGIGVAVVTYGAGAFNMVNAVACAYAEKSPLVVVSGAPGAAERQRGLLLHHQARALDSQLRVYEQLTCAQAVLDDPDTAADEIARVLGRCREQSQPVYLEVPRDMVQQAVGPVRPVPPRAYDPDAVTACAEEITARLAAARSPVLMVDVGVRRYGLEREVAILAERLGLPVATTFMGQGLLATADVDFLGTYLGRAGDPEIAERVETSDALLLLGVILSDTNFGVSARRLDLRSTIQVIDQQVQLGHHVYPYIPMRPLIEALLDRAPSAGPSRPRAADQHPHGLVADGEAPTPTDIATAVNDLFARHGPFPMACDMGDCLFTAMDIERTPLVAPGYYAGMGFGVPAGLGVQAATGERPLILVGDGAFQMTGWELGNCRRYGWNPIVIVFNNASWEMLRAFDPEVRFNDLDDWRFADLAAPLGGRGHRVTTRAELAAALDAAVADPSTFQIIDVVMPRGVRSRTLTRFVEAFEAARAGGG
jgi:indolepyruvate decarboxylase